MSAYQERGKADERSRNGRGRMPSRSWEEWFSDAAFYARENGNLLVPYAYVTEEGRRLGRWIDVQRRKYRQMPGSGRVGSLSKTEIAMLEGIGMVWQVKKQHCFADWVEAARQYYEAHGDLMVPVDYRTGDFGLGPWIQDMRKKYAQHLLRPWQIRALEQVGMTWTCCAPRRKWMDWYNDAVYYYKKNGNLFVPKHYKTMQGQKLGVWIGIQRGRFWGTWKGKPPLTKEEIRLLSQIGMVWDARARRGVQESGGTGCGIERAL